VVDTMKKADKIKIEQNIKEMIRGYSYCFTVNGELNKAYLKRFANNRFDSALYRGELTVLHLDILESNGITDTYDGIENEEIDTELRKFYTKTFISQMLEMLEIRKEEEKEIKAREKELEEESKGKTVSKKTKKTKK
jgi:hypothetical protein